MSTWFTIKPKLLVVMVVYLMLLYTTVYAFSGAETRDFKVQFSGVDLDYISIDNSSSVNDSVANGAMTGGILGALVGGFIIVAAVLSAPVTGGISIIAAFGVLTAGVSIGALAGAGYFLVASDDTVSLPGEDVVMILDQFVDTVIDFVLFLGSLLAFGALALTNVPFANTIPIQMWFIMLLMCLPVQLTIIIWFVGLLLEAIKSLRTGFKFLGG